MTGWNMPPGCNERDIPGNSPEEARIEAIYDEIWTILEPAMPNRDHHEIDAVAEALYRVVERIEREGYNQGHSDAQQAAEASREYWK